MSKFIIKNNTQLQVFTTFMASAINGILASTERNETISPKLTAELADKIAVAAMEAFQDHVPDVSVIKTN
jgi:hypothetical protein